MSAIGIAADELTLDQLLDYLDQAVTDYVIDVVEGGGSE